MARPTDGDHSTGASGSWQVQNNVYVCCDNAGSQSGDKQRITDIAAAINAAGKQAEVGMVGPSSEYYGMRGKSNTTCFWVCSGTDVEACQGLHEEYKDGWWHGAGVGDQCNIVVGFLTQTPGICTQDYITTKSTRAWDSGQYSDGSLLKRAGGKSAAQIFADTPNSGCVWGPDASSLAQAFLSGAGAASGGLQIVEGFMTSGRGESLLTFEQENFEPLVEIPFASVSVTEEDYESPTAEFVTHEKIDLFSGEVYVLITGDPGEFGGIIIKREGPDKNGMYTYTCQDYMTRIMNNQIYAIYNKGKTVHEWITEILEDQGIPTTGLEEVDEYDNTVDPDYLEEIKKEEEENRSVENQNGTPTDAQNTTGNTTTPTTPATTSDGTSSETLTTGTDEEGDETAKTNPFKKKPRGIYDKQPVVEHIRTLLFDYGVHVRFYGDVTGYPIFKAYPKEEFLSHGWVLQPELGVQTDYKTSTDITNAVTQVGVKNIEALKPTGELYTASELLGVKLAGNFGRIGILVDNPTPQGNTSLGQNTSQQMYVDKEGNTYTADQVISTNGYPSCSGDAEYNGGTKPEYQKYQKYWHNKCAICSAEKTLENKTPGSDEGGKEGVTSCTGTNNSTSTGTESTNTEGTNTQKGCGMKFCQFCGKAYGGTTRLTEVFPQTSSQANTGTGNTGTNNTSGNTSQNNNSTSST